MIILSDFINIVSFITHNPSRFVSQLRVFFNTAPMLSLISEEEIEVDFSGNLLGNSKVSIIGKLRGLLGFLSIRDITDIYVKVSSGKLPLNGFQQMRLSGEIGGFNRTEDFPVRVYQISVFLRNDLPSVFIEATRSFCKSYSDVGRNWDYLI